MMNRFIFTVFVLVLSSSCKSQSFLPFSDQYEIKKSKSVLSTYTCDDLIEKAQDKKFSLNHLAALRALARCKDFKFNMSELTDLEKKLYSGEVESFNTVNNDNKTPSEPTVQELKKSVKKEKDAKNKFALYKQLRLKLKKSTDRSEYLATTTDLYKWSLKNYKATKKNSKNKADNLNIYYEATQIYAKTFWTDDDGATALKYLDQALKVIPATTSRAELIYLKGRISEESKNYDEAVKDYDLTLADMAQFNSKNLSFTQDRVMWLKAWILYKNHQYEEATKALQALIDSTSDLSEKSRSQFYLARALKNLGKEKEAKDLLDSISQNDFFGYYGLVAYRELGKKLPALSKVKSANQLKFDLKLEFLPETERNLFTDLVKFREYSLAEKAMTLFTKSKEDEVNLSLYYAQQAKIYMPLFRTFARLNNSDKLDVFYGYTDLVFPQPYKDQVNEM
ncbi:MAG: tetratricopeptide repeat protein, partial [Pseudobdellovibrio sp.]